MKTLHLSLLLCLSLLFAGCDEPGVFTEAPVKLPDGTPVEVYKVQRGNNQSNHYIYVVRGKDTVTNNYGKNEVAVTINGRKYVPFEPETPEKPTP